MSQDNNSVYSCTLKDGGANRDQRLQGQSQSLIARSAALQTKQKNLSATLNTERTLIIDFDSSVSDNNNTFVCANASYSQITGAGALRNDQQRSKSRFGETPSLYGTIPLLGHLTNTASIAKSRLLSAQINARELHLLQSSQKKTCDELNLLVQACPVNPETHVGAGTQHTFAISEKFCIDDCNQTLSVESSRKSAAFFFPKTKTFIKAVECVHQEAVANYFKEASCRDLVCSHLHLHFETCEPHHFVPGIKFSLLNSCNLQRANQDLEPDETYVQCLELEALLQGETSCYEVYDVLSTYSFLAVPFRRPCFSSEYGVVCDQFVGSQSCITTTMFRRKAYNFVCRDQLSCAEKGNTTIFYGRHEIVACCPPALAYICCATSPQQLACFANQLIESSIYSGIEIAVRQVTYDALQDEFTVEFQSEKNVEPILRRTKNLLGTADQYSSISLSRNAMLSVANCPEAKENYLNRALKGSHFFEILAGKNDCFALFIYMKKCKKIKRFEIILSPGLYKPSELVECLSVNLNSAVECEKDYFQFAVEFTLHPTQGLLAWQQCTPGQKQNYPTLGTSPYESQTFGFLITNLKNQKFAFDFCERPLAATLDFEARQTNFATAHASRALVGILATTLGAKCEKKTCPPCKTQCMRALYKSKIDRCNGLVTIEQKGLNPLFCNTLQANLYFSKEVACCEDGPENNIEHEQFHEERDEEENKEHDEIETVENPCAVLLEECCISECCKSDCCEKNCQQTDSEEEEIKKDCEDSSFLAFQLESDSVLPLCEGDVIWITFACRTIASCVKTITRDCSKSNCLTFLIKYKLALAYGAQALYKLLRGSKKDTLLPSYLPVQITIEQLGFNIHLNPAATETRASTENALVPVKQSKQSAISKWLGFYNASTLSNQKFYTSNSCIQSLLDERLILCVPEINDFSRAEPRYGVYSPADKELTRHYGVLTLDRPSGVYKYDNSSDSLLGFFHVDRCSVDPCNLSVTNTNASVKILSFHLLRSDGSAYASCGDALVASVEICYSN